MTRVGTATALAGLRAPRGAAYRGGAVPLCYGRGFSSADGVCMGIGIGVFLLAVGLILALAVGDSIEGVDLALVGWILAGAGVLSLFLGLLMTWQKSHRSVDKTVHKDSTTE